MKEGVGQPVTTRKDGLLDVDVMLQVDDQQGEYLFSDIILLGEKDGTIKSDPNSLEVHGAMLNDLANFFVLQDAISLPAAYSGQIEELGTVNKARTLDSSDCDTLVGHLKVESILFVPLLDFNIGGSCSEHMGIEGDLRDGVGGGLGTGMVG